MPTRRTATVEFVRGSVRGTRRRALATLPSLFTLGNMMLGFAAILVAIRGNHTLAAVLIGVSIVFDITDGAVARLVGAVTPFGLQFDSLADLVSFGAAPAFTIYLSVLDGVPVAGVGACLAFLLCGAWRLARFPLVANSRRHFVGLPIPLAGAVVAVVAALDPPAALALAATLALALLMVSVLPFPTPAAFLRPGRAPRGVEVDETSIAPK